MSGEAALLRFLQLSTALANIAYELTRLNELLVRAHAEGRTLTADDWAQLDADLAAAKASAHTAAPAGGD